MILKVAKGDDVVFIDNEGEVLGKVKVSGDQPLADNISFVLNQATEIKFKGLLKGVPEELVVRDEKKPPKINKAKDLYLKDYFIRDLKLQGFEVEVMKE